MRACCVLGPVAGAGDAVTNKIDQVGAGEIIQLASFLHSILQALVRRPGRHGSLYLWSQRWGPEAGRGSPEAGRGLAYMASSGPARNAASKINE